jgi:hypothetical protein
MGDDVVEFPRGRAKVFTEDEALAYPLGVLPARRPCDGARGRGD